jgi:hypothetical protein
MICRRLLQRVLPRRSFRRLINVDPASREPNMERNVDETTGKQQSSYFRPFTMRHSQPFFFFFFFFWYWVRYEKAKRTETESDLRQWRIGRRQLAKRIRPPRFSRRMIPEKRSAKFFRSTRIDRIVVERRERRVSGRRRRF